jgi:hypothetical protein
MPGQGLDIPITTVLDTLFVSVAELEAYLAERVKALTKGQQKPMTGKPGMVEDYRVIHVRQGR